MTDRRKNRSITTFSSCYGSDISKNINMRSHIGCLDVVLGENINHSIYKRLSEGKNDFGDCKLSENKSTTGSDLEDIFDLKLSGISSSSSLSWSDDYDSEVGKKVQSELEKIDRCFQGLEVCTPYNKEEIDEWLHFFPHLYILGYKTPLNSLENSEISSESDEETLTDINRSKDVVVFSNSKTKDRSEQLMQRLFYQKGHHLQQKPKSLDIDKYLRISSIKSPYFNRKKEILQPLSMKNPFTRNQSSEHVSLPFLTTTPLKAKTSRPKQQKPVSKLILPPIMNNIRSVSATPRQSSSKSMFVRLNFDKDANAKEAQMQLKSDLLKLFEYIPISNR